MSRHRTAVAPAPALPAPDAMRWATTGAREAEAYRAQVIATGALPVARNVKLDVELHSQRIAATVVVVLSIVATLLSGWDLSLILRAGPG